MSPIGGATVASAATNTVVSLEFDDGYDTQYQLRPMLSAHGMHGTFFINSGTRPPSYNTMSWTQLHDLANDGNEIGGHTIDHADLPTLSTSAATAEVCNDRTALQSQGFNVTSFAYPYGHNNPTLWGIVQGCGYSSARDVSGIISPEGCGGPCPYAESIPPANAFDTRTPQNTDEDTPLSELEGFVTQAENHGGGWVQLVFHDICSPGPSCDYYSIPPATFNTLLDFIASRAANGTVVRTVGEVIGAHVSASLTRNVVTPRVGRRMTFTSVVTNDGGASASGVDVVFSLDPSYANVVGSTSQGSCQAEDGTFDMHCPVGTIASGASVTVSASVTPTSVASNRSATVIAYPTNAAQSSTQTLLSNVAARRGPADFDGNGSTDIGVYRPSVGGWYLNGQATTFLGLSGDVPVPGDYNGDGTTDIAVYRPSVGGWYVNGQATVFFGLSGDIPVPGDYNGDGTTDIAVYRPSVGGWYIRNQPTVFYGLSTDTPVPGDYNGDGATDPAVYRPSVGGWYIRNQTTVFHGISTDTPVPGDYNGDGTTDPAVYRAGSWLIRNQPTVFLGLAGDIPVQGDYNADGTTDVAIYRPSVGGWFINGQATVFFGLSGDIPTPKRPGS